MNENQNEQKQYDPRFYLIKIHNIKNLGINSKILKNKSNLRLKFQLGNKHSQSILQFIRQPQKERFNLQNNHVYEEIHIMKFGGEQYVNIFMDQIDKNGSSIEKGLTCFARILLPPLIELPHSRHRVSVTLWNNIVNLDNNSSQPEQMLEVTLDIYYQLNFKGKIQLIPTIADLQRNIAEIGQMKPIIYLKYENREWKSLEAQAGIHPCWSGHFYAKRDKVTKVIHNLQNIQQNIKINQTKGKQSQLMHIRKYKLLNNSISANKGENANSNLVLSFLNQNGPYFDCMSFDMACAGSSLNIQIFSLPFIGSKPQLIGSANIRISNSGFLKHPRRERDNIYEQKSVNLYFQQQGNQVKIGSLKFYTRFVFDINRIIDKEPSIYQIQ